jgi:hypothetical protein
MAATFPRLRWDCRTTWMDTNEMQLQTERRLYDLFESGHLDTEGMGDGINIRLVSLFFASCCVIESRLHNNDLTIK